LLTEQQFSTACTASFYEHHHDLHLHRDWPSSDPLVPTRFATTAVLSSMSTCLWWPPFRKTIRWLAVFEQHEQHVLGGLPYWAAWAPCSWWLQEWPPPEAPIEEPPAPQL
jgi:hypothetical protein